MPRVSVYLPTRNRAALLERAVGSVLGQTFTDLELIVVDDGSTDGTPALLGGIAARDARLRVLRHGQPRGAPAARNAAIRAAGGEFITGLDDDDWMLPGRLSRFVAAWEPRHAFLCSGWWLAGPRWTRPIRARAASIEADTLLHGNVVGNQVFTRTERIVAVGAFDETMVASQDHELWTRLVLRYGAAWRLAEPTLVVTADRAGMRISAPDNALRGVDQFAAKFADRFAPEHRCSLALLRRRLAGEPLSLREALRLWTPATRRAVLLALLRDRLPAATALERAWWRWRWPAARGPQP
jgi:glycosyltransferase involved in cell wall biosynthesis